MEDHENEVVSVGGLTFTIYDDGTVVDMETGMEVPDQFATFIKDER